jgi:DNA transformation protein
MPVSPDFRDFVLEQLNRLAPTTGRPMFGGVGLYVDDVIVGLIDDDTLYFKVDDATRPAFEAAGGMPFQPFGPDTKPMGYYTVPAEAVDDAEALAPWFERARAAAAGAKKPAKKKPERGAHRVDASVEIAAPPARVWEAWHAPTARRLWLHVAGVATRRVSARSSMRLTWKDGSDVSVTFGSIAGGRTTIDVRHDGIRTAADAREIDEIWETSLRRLKTRLERRRG